MTDHTVFKVRTYESNFREIKVHKGDMFRSHHRTDYAIHRFPNGNALLERVVDTGTFTPPEYQQISDCIIYGEILDCMEDKIAVKGTSVIMDWDPGYKPVPRTILTETKWFPEYPSPTDKEPEIFWLENKGIYDSFEILHFRGEKHE